MNWQERAGARSSGRQPPSEKRHRGDAALFALVELDPSVVVDCEAGAGGCYLADAVVMSGGMREVCPVCRTHLKLVLRQTHVKRAHMFCEQCTRCFDASYMDGSSALSLD